MDGQDEGGEVGEVKENRSKRKDEAEAEVIAGTEVVVLGEHSDLRAGGEFGVRALESLSLRFRSGSYCAAGAFIRVCGRVGRGAG